MVVDLLDYLVLHTSASFLSDLRFYRDEVALALMSLHNAAAFSLDDWNRAGSYLCARYEPQPSPEAAREAMLEVLASRA